ncbi:MAG: hypothetical protein AB7L66_04585 [Gemmatimonadales bacterium]
MATEHTGRWVLLAMATLALACAPAETGRLSADQETRFATEGVLFRADNQVFRYTHDAGGREAGWEDRDASIVVTAQSVLIHKNEKVGIEITPSSRRFYEVHREGDRVRINAGSGKSREVWSFVPPDSADAWTRAIRAVIRNSKSTANDP